MTSAATSLSARRIQSGLLRAVGSCVIDGPIAGPSRLPRTLPLQRRATVQPLHIPTGVRFFTASSKRREQDREQQQQEAQKLGEIEPKLALTFTCTVDGCGERSSHQFTKRSYEKGIVLVQCPGCKNRHLIADHLGWFAQDASEPKTIEEMVAQKGGRVQRGVNWVDDKGYDTVEIFDDAEPPSSSAEEKK